MHVYRVAEQGWVAARRDDGIGKRSLSLHPTAKPAGDTAAISSLSPPLALSISLTHTVFCSISFFFFLTSEYIPFIFFYPSRNLSSALSTHCACSPDVFLPRFLSVLFSLYSSSPLLLFCFLAVTWLLCFHTTNCTLCLPSQTKCVSNWN